MNSNRYLVFNVAHEWGTLCGLEEMLKLLRRYRTGLFVLDYDKTIAEFTLLVGSDTSMECGTEKIAGVAGVSMAVAHYWDKLGVLRSSISPARGSGYVRKWAWRDAFWAGLAGCLSRQGVSLATLKKLADGFFEETTAEAADASAAELIPCN